jgi:transposase
MMGRRERGQGQFFYAFDLDKVVPADHLVRQIDGVLDLDWVHKELASYYSHTGRPSIDPVLMIRMLIVGYMFALRSERRLCSEVQVNLAYRWFCKLGIEDGIPDHSVLSRARHERFRQSDALRRVFEGVVAKCIAAGLVGGEGFSIDASLIRADAGKKKRVPGDQPIAWPRAEEASRAVREYLAVLDAAHNDEENSGEDGSSSGGGNRRKPPKEVSLTDPQAAWVARKNTDPFFAYDANYLIDNKAGIIVDAEGTRANRIAEIAITETMIERVKDRFDLRPRRLTPFMARSGCSSGWRTVTSRRTSRSGTNRHDPMAPSAGPISSSTDRATSTSARMESCCTPQEQSSTAVRFAIVPQSAIAISALSKCSAAPTRLRGRFPAILMRTPAMSPAHWPKPRLSNNHAGSAKRSRCSLRI